MNHGEVKNVSSSALRFIGDAELNNATIRTIPACIFNGLICGVVGAVNIKLTFKLKVLRNKYIKAKWLRLIEVCIVTLVTTTAFFWMPYFLKADCAKKSTIAPRNKDLLVSYDCPEGEYNPFATMFFNAEGDALRTILSRYEGPGGIQHDMMHLRTFLCMWFLLTIVTDGIWVPAGRFVPSIIIGASIGAVMEQTY